MPTTLKENVHPNQHHAPMSQTQRKRKAEISAEAPSKKGKGRSHPEVDLDDIDALRADNSALRSRIEELSKAFDDLHNLRHTEPEQRVQDLLDKAQAVQKGLEASIKEHKEETRRLRQQIAAGNTSPDRRGPASPAVAASQSTQRRQYSKADEAALAQAKQEGIEIGNDERQQLEAQIVELQTRFAAEQKRKRQAPTEPPSDATLDLLSDLSGFTIIHTLEQPREDVLREFRCLLTDMADKRLSFNFRLDEHPDGSVSYTPNLDETRDEMLLERFTDKYDKFRNFMRFDRSKLSAFSRRLYTAVNGR